MPAALWSKMLMEFIGTFFLCLTVGMSAALSALAPLAIGGVLMCFVYTGAHVSGANYNPAVSFALAIRGALSWKDFICYVIAQLAASVAAGCVALVLHNKRIGQDTTAKGYGLIGHPAIDMVNFDVPTAFLAEVCYTFALCFVVLNVATTAANAKNQFFGLAIGFTVTAGACSGGPVSGGAFNPAVGFGLPLIAGNHSDMAVYFLGPMLGGGLAAGFFFITNLDEWALTKFRKNGNKDGKEYEEVKADAGDA